MSRKPWSLVFYLFVLMFVIPVGMRAYYQRWWIRDPDRLCRIALAAMNRKDYGTARPLLMRATRLKPDWFVPYHMLSKDVWRNGWFDKAIDWLYDNTPSPIDSVADDLREYREKQVNRIVNSVDPKAFEWVGDSQELWEVWKKDARASALFEKGLRLHHAKRWRDSAKAMEKGLARYPDFYWARTVLIRTYALMNDPERTSLRLMDLTPGWASQELRELSSNETCTAHLRSRRPGSWRLHFQNYYLDRTGWTVKAIPDRPGGIGCSVNSMAAARGEAWVVTDHYGTTPRFGVWRLAQGKWSRHPIDSEVLKIYRLEDGTVVAATTTSGASSIKAWSGDGFVSLHREFPFWFSYQRVIQWRGEIWAHTRSGLLRRRENRWLFYPWPPEPTPPGGKSPSAGGLATSSLPNWITLQADTGLAKQHTGEPSPPRFLCTDHHGRLWCGDQFFDGTRFVWPEASLLRWKRRSIIDLNGKTWGPEEGFWGRCGNAVPTGSSDNRFVRGMIDAKRRMWLMGYADNLLMWDGHQIQMWKHADGLPTGEVRSLALDGNTLWVATNRGIGRARIPD